MNNLFQTINKISGGMYADQAEAELAQIVQAVEETGRQGTLTLTIKVAKSANCTMSINGTISSKPPAGDPMSVVLFSDVDGRLTETMPGMDDSKKLFDVNDDNQTKTVINAGDK